MRNSSVHFPNCFRKMSKSPFDNYISVLFAMFFLWVFFLCLNYTDSRLPTPNVFHDAIEDFDDIYSFEFQKFTYTCENQKCVKVPLRDNDEVSLETCLILCSGPQIWPKPSSLILSDNSWSIIDKRKVSFKYPDQGLVKIMLQNATASFMQNLEFLKLSNGSTPSFELNINIIFPDLNILKLKLETNESYTLKIKKDKVIAVDISAKNYFGARHALETLSQLIWYDNIIDEIKIVHDVEIEDSPKFAYRGVMVDTARNYIPMSLLRKTVDGMAMAKLNVLHLHLTDIQSFPIVLPRAPILASVGAYSADKLYTPEDIKDLISYGMLKGVRVVLEIDAPAHINEGWNLIESDKKFAICNQLNPDNDNVLWLLEKIYKDLLDIADDTELFHIGGDEVNLSCWEKTKAASEFSKSMDVFWANYTNKMLERLKRANNDFYPDKVIMWSSKLTESRNFNLLYNVTVQVWLGNPKTVLTSGHSVIYSTVGHWYLDCGFGPWNAKQSGGSCDPYTHWYKFYSHRPWKIYGYRNLAIGGETCLWTEQVDVDTFETRIWPRAAAFAERVWGDPEDYDHYDVTTRFVSFTDRMKNRGIKSAGIWPEWCSQNPGKC